MSQSVADPWKANMDVMEMTDKDLVEAGEYGISLYDADGDVRPLVEALSDEWDLTIGKAVDRALRLYLSHLLSAEKLESIKEEYGIEAQLPSKEFVESWSPLDIDLSEYEEGEGGETLSAYTTKTIREILREYGEELGYEKDSHLAIDAIRFALGKERQFRV